MSATSFVLDSPETLQAALRYINESPIHSRTLELLDGVLSILLEVTRGARFKLEPAHVAPGRWYAELELPNKSISVETNSAADCIFEVLGELRA
jgi:hypothetical protein